MDLETENRIASVLLREAAELRRQAQQDGVLAYLRQPSVRGRPNSRFLTATVRGIQQVNKAVEVDEMWRVRQKELELEDRLKGRSRDRHSLHSSRGDNGELSGRQSKRCNSNTSCSSSKRSYEDYSKEDEGLRDEEIEAFLHSRLKRGRGSVGSRMDEAGPYLPHSSESPAAMATNNEDERQFKAILGPEKPSSWKHHESSDGWSDDDDEQKRSKKKPSSSRGSKMKHSKKHKSKEKSKDKKKKKKEKRHRD